MKSSSLVVNKYDHNHDDLVTIMMNLMITMAILPLSQDYTLKYSSLAIRGGLKINRKDNCDNYVNSANQI